MATINLPKSPILLGNFCKRVKIFNSSPLTKELHDLSFGRYSSSSRTKAFELKFLQFNFVWNISQEGKIKGRSSEEMEGRKKERKGEVINCGTLFCSLQIAFRRWNPTSLSTLSWTGASLNDDHVHAWARKRLKNLTFVLGWYCWFILTYLGLFRLQCDQIWRNLATLAKF